MNKRRHMPLVYALVDPGTSEIRYIGKSMYGLWRPRVHWSPSVIARDCTHCGRWIRQLVAAGLRPEIRILEETDLGALADAEMKWIAHGRALGWPLTNHTDGGEGTPGRRDDVPTRARRAASVARHYAETPSSVERSRRSAQKLWTSKDHRTRMSSIMRGRVVSDEAKKKNAAAHRGRPMHPRTRAALLMANKGRHVSEDTRAKLGRANRGKQRTPEFRAQLSAIASNRKLIWQPRWRINLLARGGA